MSERITGHTELIGLMAYPIRHSSSPAMQNEAFAKLGYDYAYLAFEVGADEIEDAVKAIRTLKMRGSNVSMPNKTLVGQYLDELSPAAEMCGAVNTIVNDHGHLTGHITDGIGFMAALKDNNIDAIGKKMTIVGAGGAATAIEIQAALDGVGEIVIFNRKDEFWDRAVSTVEKINTRTSSHAVLYDLSDLDQLKKEMADSYIFVNATGVGMKPLEGQSVVPDKSYFRPELIVVDVPYSPLETTMRSMAKEVGCKTMNGLGMMLFQGSAAFELWTGEPMPIEHMKRFLISDTMTDKIPSVSERTIMKTVQVRNITIGEGRPKICVPIVGQTKEDILLEAGTFERIPVDVVEWRVDWFENVFDTDKVLDVAKDLQTVLKDTPILFTFRTAKEGGEKAISSEDYKALNMAVAKSGYVDFIDVEAFTGEEIVKSMIQEAHSYGVKVIASNHDFDATPEKDEIVRRLRMMQDYGADIPKMAVMPKSKQDVLTLLSATLEMSEQFADRPIITMSMAGTGVVSRLTGETFGSALTFGAATKASAPGQINVNELEQVLDIIHKSL